MKCDKSPYDVDLAVVHGNGVFTSLADAKANLEKLRPLVDTKLGLEPYAASYALAYNQEKGLIPSLYKLARERLSMTGAEIIRFLSGQGELTEPLRDELTRFATEYVQAGFGEDPSLEKHVTMYREHLRSGRKVLVIAHSEGNFYANAAYKRLFKSAVPTPGERSFGIVGVALPAPRLEGWHPEPECRSLGCYTTLDEDKVILGVELVLEGTADPNIPDDTKGTDDSKRHDLIATYLANPAAREQIMTHVAAFVDAFEELEPTLNDSSITAYLSWNSKADLDLHVFEGTNAHVYPPFPESKDGGHIDADNQDGSGPEHYFAECAALKHGNFTFALGYYAGEGPVTAQLRIKVGSVSRSYERVLPEPTGDRSLTRPISIAQLKVQDRFRPRRDEYDNTTDTLIDDYEVEFVEIPPLH